MCWGARTAAVAALIALFAAGNAGAATPQEIYRDLADNGKADRAYSQADLDRAFGKNPSIPSYERRLDEAQRTPQMVHRAPAEAPSGESGASLPFTGLDAALLGAVSAPLLLLGAGMRRFGRRDAGGVT